MKHFLDDNGLVDGNIPKGQACPFLQKCGLRVDGCPTKEKPNNLHNYSCAAARAHSLCRQQENGTLLNIIRKKDRRA